MQLYLSPRQQRFSDALAATFGGNREYFEVFAGNSHKTDGLIII